ncbi:MAG: hypothetical protein AAF078_13995 [Planctomycetota bacterium]
MTEAQKKTVRNESTRKRLFAGGLGVLGASVLAGGVYVWWLNTPPGLPSTLDEAVAVYASARYENLPQSRKPDYARRTQALLSDATDEQRQAFFKAVSSNEDVRDAAWDTRRAAMLERAKEYALASKAEQEAMLDQMAAEMMAMREAMRAAFAERRAEREAMSEEERAQERAERMAAFAERMDQMAASGNPQEGRLMRAMMRDARSRMGGGGEGRGGGHGGVAGVIGVREAAAREGAGRVDRVAGLGAFEPADQLAPLAVTSAGCHAWP